MADVNVIFNFNGTKTTIQCKSDVKMKEIFRNFATKALIDINSIFFIYGGKIINEELKFNELFKPDEIKNEINILVSESNNTTKDQDEGKVKSKDIICPKCNEICLIKIKDYKIKLYGCKNGHINSNILLDEFEDKQKMNVSKIICNDCNNTNRSQTYNNVFYKCITCKKDICPLCKLNHNQHEIINYDKKNFRCDKHNDLYNSYCNKCKLNLCMRCENVHNEEYHKENTKEHNIIEYKEIIEDNNEIKKEIDEFKKKIDKLNNNIKEIIKILNKIINNMNILYEINNNMIKNYDNENKNYEILKNIKEIRNNIKLDDDINNIINENNIINKFNKIMDLYYKMNNIENTNINEDLNEIIIKYNINKNDEKIKIFGEKFVENNKDKCNIIYKEKKYELSEYFDIQDNNDKTLEIKLIVIKNITDMEQMFHKCSSLSPLTNLSKLNTSNVTNMSALFNMCESLTSLPDISKWNTSNVNDMGFMFAGCDSLTSLPDISKWDTSNVNNMESMFYSCQSLISLPNISEWDTSNVTNMESMFEGCKSLTSLPDILKWDTSNVTNIGSIFDGCKSLASLPDISRWNTSKATNI